MITVAHTATEINGRLVKSSSQGVVLFGVSVI